ncbi:hypothetical protein, variant [Exophiala oligosperma]|uniref:Casein kinase substrate phosphoprotein PP28 domain-containing protein n=2 Tax=Chaetothyriales TaxID=34395 RepID=A0A0D2DME5_9EURO|nr:uncharacterized protein PV06_04701 [Exophiala oligosperma]XP_016263832.1 hypothetical protein, variant [Exophiala oligosperma]KAJ9631311.1 hypothetical protein H2204_008253 [Knufia peltigerae]KIW43615.1 hypothetical protein PV06_04701 [Exophiala oligosperma]KIW43616.1 hypothetical protein, variant [Exophiala oligosperma]
MPPRGRGGKFSKPTRGGGKHFSRDLQPLDSEGNQMGMWRDPADAADSSSEEEEDEDESSEEESSDEEGGASSKAPAASGELTREQRKEAARLKKQAAIAKKNKKVAAVGDMPSESEEEEEASEDNDDDMPANPNHTQKARSMARAATGPSGEQPIKKTTDKENLSRREREAIAAQQAKERYQKLHAEGKTDEARADLARLKLIREQREAAAARKQAEKEERDAREKDRDDREAKRREAALGAGGAKKSAKGKK